MKNTNLTKGFAQIPRKMICSQAFNSLSGKGHIILSYLLSQCRHVEIKRKKGHRSFILTNKDELILPYRSLQASPYKMAYSTITKGIDELLSKGFIKVMEQGGRAKGHVSVYGLIDAYLKWGKGDPPVSVRRPYAKRGFCASKIKEEKSCVKN